MKPTALEKTMKMYGIVLIIILVLGIPSFFMSAFMAGISLDFAAIIKYLIATALEILFAVLLVRRKKDLFSVAVTGCMVLRLLVFAILNISSYSIIGVINIIGNVALLLYVAVNSISKFTEYRQRIDKIWFLPCSILFSEAIISITKEISENIASRGGQLEIFEALIIGVGTFSSLIAVFPYFLYSLWIHKSYKKENEIISTEKVEIVEQVSKTYEAPYKEKRVSCRAIIIKEDKILYSFESKTGFYMSPGGSLEQGEDLVSCLTREVLEETGYIVKPVKRLLDFHEYCYDKLYISHYYICEIYGEGKRSLTKTEEDKGMVPKWLSKSEALEIFHDYETKTPDKESLYKREFTVLEKL